MNAPAAIVPRRRVVIADDEPLARERIHAMLQPHAGYEVVAECGDGPSAVAAIADHQPDLVLLDVRMPGLDGFDVVAALEALERTPAVIFVTAFSEHAVKAFEVGAVDYLMKPFDAARFAQALERSERHAGGGIARHLREYLASLRLGPAYPERFVVRGPHHIYFVPAAEIEWVDVASNYVRLHAGGRPHLVRDTLTAFATRLDPERFIRVHRSALVRIDTIARIEPHERGDYRLTLRDGAQLTTSRTYSDRVRALLR